MLVEITYQNAPKNPNPTATYFFPLLMHANELDIDLDEKK